MGLIVGHNQSHPFELNLKKAIQAVAFLLKQNHETNKTDNYMRLLKLLYFADRESLKETGRPITGDCFVAMPHGPTLSRLLDLVNQKDVGNIEWDKYIQTEGYNIRLIQDPGNDKLCRYEIDLLTKIWSQNREKGEWQIALESENLPEWKKNDPGESSKPISLSDVLEALGNSAWLQDIIETSAESTRIKHILKTDC